jgi:hypothetical protein
MAWNDKKARWHGANRPGGKPRQFVINGQEFDRVPYGDGDQPIWGERNAHVS